MASWPFLDHWHLTHCLRGVERAELSHAHAQLLGTAGCACELPRALGHCRYAGELPRALGHCRYACELPRALGHCRYADASPGYFVPVGRARRSSALSNDAKLESRVRLERLSERSYSLMHMQLLSETYEKLLSEMKSYGSERPCSERLPSLL